ncbi:TolC family protein [Oxalobacteraceae bacterium R-40]|uniref:TolC family protein n=1 Tax=Keguizhuia sedimenti TaxID=3064264 RepID=A0ABU1BT02_9BURK|nr:TolC family protein [Oxalobacteraceae bacterium R-40]
MLSPKNARLVARPMLSWQGWGIAAACLGSFIVATSALANTFAISLPEAQRLAIERSRQLAAKDYAVAASTDMAIAAGQLPDPVVSAGIENLPLSGDERFSLSKESMTMRRIGVMQEITRSEKRRYRSERYEREAEKGLAEKANTIAAIQRDTALAWLDLYYAQQAAQIVSETGDQAKLEIQAAQGAYRGGRGTQSDVIAAQSALTSFEDRMSEAKRRVTTAKTMLARWIGEAAYSPLAMLPELNAIRLDKTSLATELAHHPEISVLKKQEEVAVAEANLARANKKADWSVELAYQQRGSEYGDMVSVGISIPLQWDQKNRQERELAAKLAMVEEAKAEREEQLRMHIAQTEVLINEWQNGKERLGRYRQELIPLANQRTAAAIAAYRGGKGMLSDVLMARRNEIDTRLQALQLEMDTARLWAQLNYLTPDDSLANPHHPSAGEK